MNFFDKAFALSNTNNASQDPAHCSFARFACDGACLVCVCVCIQIGYSIHAICATSAIRAIHVVFIHDITIHP